MTTDFIPLVVEVSFDSRNKGSQLSLVGILDLGDGKSRGGLLVDNSTQTSLALDNAVGHTHLAAQSRQEDNQLDRVNVVSNHNQLSLLLFDQGRDVVQTVLDDDRLVGLHNLLALGLSSGKSPKTFALLNLGFRAVLVQELEELSSRVLVQGLGELVNGWRHLQALVNDLLLALKTDVSGPLDETGHIALGLNVLANAEVLGTLLNERVSGGLRGLLTLGGKRGRSDLLSGGLLGWGLYSENKKINVSINCSSIVYRCVPSIRSFTALADRGTQEYIYSTYPPFCCSIHN